MESHVLKILEDYLAWEELKAHKKYHELTFSEKDELRLENDYDAKYFYKIERLTKENALYADTVISFWTPYTRLLEIEAGWKSYKTIKSLESLIRQIKSKRKNDFTESIKQVNNNIEDFAKLYDTKGNFMLLPKRQMNNQRYKITEDRIDLTLYNCFKDGELALFFKSENALKIWIDEQDLNDVFIEGECSQDKINWFVKEDARGKMISEMNADEIYEYLNNAISLIQRRNK